MSIIGQRIKTQRELRGWTQEELAEKMGYKSKSTINKIELGINDIVQSKIVKFAEVLGVSVSYLMGWNEEYDSAMTFRSDSLKDLSSIDNMIDEAEKEQLLKWKEVVGDTIFTENEFNQIVAYAKFLISQRS